MRTDDRVACLLPNISPMLVSHLVVPLAGAVVVAINTRLSNDEVQCILGHSGATLLIADSVLLANVLDVVAATGTLAEVVRVVDPATPGPEVRR